MKRILIANRGEIAVRIIRTCRDMGKTAVAVFSDVDRTALHVQLADEAFRLGGQTAAESYLDQEKILRIAVEAKVDAIHPGYGFLSENPSFAEAVTSHGIVFIGPSSQSILQLGNKNAARLLAQRCNVPTVSGTDGVIESESEGLEFAKKLGFPVLLKAAAGGGGKGMRIVATPSEFQSAYRAARSESKSSFGDDRVYLEKFIENPRHIEIQILADHHGNVVSLGERECSIQRRHQKVMEETPSPMVTADLRRRMSDAAVRVVREARYSNACTVEFLVDNGRNFYFLEVNTRLQVEHPVTELVTGLDLVKQQIRIAQGEVLGFSQDEIPRVGHALECRICAEDPSENFFPSTGRLRRYSVPQGPRIRVDNGFQTDDEISVYYDPLLAKLISWGETREETLATMRRALTEFRIEGVKTTIPFCLFVVDNDAFQRGEYNTQSAQQYTTLQRLSEPSAKKEVAVVIGATKLKQLKSKSLNYQQTGMQGKKWRVGREDSYR
jgi:acetyl-CoA carboxylase biotin carboxylase subunit